MPDIIQEPLAPATPPAEPAPEAAKHEPVSPQFNMLANKEKRIFKERQAIAAEKAAFEAEKAQLAREREEIQNFRSRREQYRQNPSLALEDTGLTYQQLTEFYLNDGKLTPDQQVRQVQEDLQRLREEQIEREKLEQKNRLEQQAQIVKEAEHAYAEDIGDAVKSNPERFEMIDLYEAHDLVFEVAEEWHAKHGQILTPEQACEKVEKYLREKAKKVAQAKALRPSQSDAAPNLSAARPNRPTPAPTRTLSNNLTPTSPTLMSSPRVEQDRMARALAALERGGK